MHDLYPHFRDHLGVRLTRETCHIRRLIPFDDVVEVSGTAWMFLQELDGQRRVADIVDRVAEQTGVERNILAVDLRELLEDLERREVVALAEAPADRSHAYLRVVAPGILSSLHIDITHRCNEVCIHCLVDKDDAEVPFSKLEGIVVEAAELGFASLSLSGGEPSLHRGFWELLDLAADYGFVLTLFTNAITMTPPQLERLAGYYPEQVRVSVYSMRPEVHDRITRVPGSLDKTLRAIEQLKQHGVRLYINCPVMALSFDGFREVAEWAEANGFESNMDPVIQQTRDRSRSFPDLQLTYDQAKEVTAFQQTSPELVANVQPGEPVCNLGADPSVDAQLNVYACPGLRLPMGNLGEQTLEEVLRNPLLERVGSLALEDLEVCQRCAVREGCYRCHGHAYQQTGDYTSCSTMDRRQAQIRREIMVERGTLPPLEE